MTVWPFFFLFGLLTALDWSASSCHLLKWMTGKKELQSGVSVAFEKLTFKTVRLPRARQLWLQGIGSAFYLEQTHTHLQLIEMKVCLPSVHTRESRWTEWAGILSVWFSNTLSCILCCCFVQYGNEMFSSHFCVRVHIVKMQWGGLMIIVFLVFSERH